MLISEFFIYITFILELGCYITVQSLLFLFYLEICAISKISKKEIGRCFKLILRALETSVDLITSGDFMVCCFSV